MSRQINQPSNQVRLTNVAVVRCNKAGKRFEIACYRNKVMDYRAGLEKDLSEVLQTDHIFTNVSKGKFANMADLELAFGTRDETAIAKIILNDDHGNKNNTLQVSDLERQQQFQNTTSQIATWVASNCVHPDTGRPYTVSQIKHALGKNYTVHPHKAIKKQYLDCVKFLKNVIPIERAKMELALEFPAQVQKSNVEPVLKRLPHVRVAAASTLAPDNKTATNHRNNNNNDSTSSSMITICVQVDPSHYRELDELMKSVGGRLEILQQVVAQKEGDVDLEVEVLKRNKQQQQQQQQQNQQSSNNSNEPNMDPTKKQPPRGGGSNAVVLVDNDDEEGVRLVEKLEKVRLQAAGGGGGGDEEKDNDDNDSDHQPMNKKSLRKAQKKNKKAKQRRDVEEQQAALLEEEERLPEDGHAIIDASSAVATAAKEDVVKSNIAAVQPHQQQEQRNQNQTSGATDSKSCNTCGGTFANAAQYRAHFRTDWHRFNQKLKLKGIAAVSEQEFQLCDAEEFFGTTN